MDLHTVSFPRSKRGLVPCNYGTVSSVRVIKSLGLNVYLSRAEFSLCMTLINKCIKVRLNSIDRQWSSGFISHWTDHNILKLCLSVKLLMARQCLPNDRSLLPFFKQPLARFGLPYVDALRGQVALLNAQRSCRHVCDKYIQFTNWYRRGHLVIFGLFVQVRCGVYIPIGLDS